MEDRTMIAMVIMLVMAGAAALLVSYKLAQRRRFVERQQGRGKSGERAAFEPAE
jgi:hypothetical protein